MEHPTLTSVFNSLLAPRLQLCSAGSARLRWAQDAARAGQRAAHPTVPVWCAHPPCPAPVLCSFWCFSIAWPMRAACARRRSSSVRSVSHCSLRSAAVAARAQMPDTKRATNAASAADPAAAAATSAAPRRAAAASCSARRHCAARRLQHTADLLRHGEAGRGRRHRGAAAAGCSWRQAKRREEMSLSWRRSSSTSPSRRRSRCSSPGASCGCCWAQPLLATAAAAAARVSGDREARQGLCQELLHALGIVAGACAHLCR